MRDDSLARVLFLDPPFDVDAISAGTSRLTEKSVVPMLTFAALGAAGDLFIVSVLSALLFTHIRSPAHLAQEYLKSIALTGLAALVFISTSNLYKIEVIADFRRFLRRLGRVWPALALALVIAELALMPKVQPAAPGIVMHGAAAIALWFILGWAAIAVERYALAGLFRSCVKAGFVCHKVVVVGATEAAAEFIETVQQAQLGARVVAVFDVEGGNLRGDLLAGVPVRGGIAELLNYHKDHEIDTVVVALPWFKTTEMRELVQRLSLQPLCVRLLPDNMTLKTPAEWFAPTGELPGVQLLRLTDLPIERSGLIIKSLFDKLAAAIALLFFAPLMLSCAAIIKITSPGPVFFKQPRIGLRNRTFQMYKFRSMHVSECGYTRLTERNDQRIFPFGSVMRKLSFDELPQLINVLKGDMSMVGPRPHMPQARAAGELYYDVVDDYASRHRVKPGITGWAQVNGWRGPTETFEQLENRVLYDLYYIENWSLFMDIKILLRTALVGFFGKNAF